MNPDAHGKVTAAHLGRNAYLYVRQSTLRQVFENTESTERQYDLRQRAVALGWSAEQIVVIDCDLGRSAAAMAERQGFQRLTAEVALERAGIVMGLEVSRLARDSQDWHRLLKMCALSNTLILDEDGVYDPSAFNDRLLLGLKGAMSEAELHLLRCRLQGGLLNKARRGELEVRLPVGFVYDDAGKVILDPDRQVQESVRLFFGTFRRTGTAGATARLFQEQRLRFPSRPFHGPRKGELVWRELRESHALDLLHNVRYAGAYAHGRTRKRRRADGRIVTRRLPREEWTVLIRDAHEGYITWEEFEENERRLRDNGSGFRRQGGASPPREGPALLQGLLVCGVCGNRMTTVYHMRDGRLIPGYVCGSSHRPWKTVKYCQRITSSFIDEAIGELVVREMNPVSLAVALDVQRQIEARAQEADRLRHREVERAEYQADAARRRYMRVDPDNRLVADTLEADWNAKLRAVKKARQDYERRRQRDGVAIDADKRQKIMDLATDFPRLWAATSTGNQDRKRMLRLLVEDVTLVREPAVVRLHVRFRGGKTETLAMDPPLRSWQKRLTSPEVVAEIDRLLEDHTKGEVAEILNEQGHRTGTGLAFDAQIIKNICNSYRLESREQRLRNKGLLTSREMSQRLGVSIGTICRWRQEGRLESHRCNDKNEHLFEPLPAEAGPRLRRRRAVVESQREQRIEEV